MMKKIRSIKQLQTEKKRIKQRQEELENKILHNWEELKECLRPENIAKDVFSKVIKDKTAENLNGDGIFKSTFTYGVSLLIKKFADKAGEKFDRIFKK